MSWRNSILACTWLAAAVGLTLTAFADDVRLPERDARAAAKVMRSNNVSLTKAIDAAESHCDGKAVSAVCRTNGNSPVIEVCCLDAKDNFQVVLVDAGTGHVKSMERAQFRDQGSAATWSILKATDIIDKNVKNVQGESLGEIKDIVIDPSRGRIGYAVLSFGGVLGFNDKLFAVPWGALNSQRGETFILDVDKSQLERLPGFDKKQWPDMNNLEWGRSIHGAYKLHPYWESDTKPVTAPLALTKASEFLGRKVTNAADENLGKIEDLAIDSESGRIEYAVLSFGGFLGINDKLFAIPWNGLSFSTDGKCILSVPKERLKVAPGFDKKHWPDMADPEFGRSIHGYYGKTGSNSRGND